MKSYDIMYAACIIQWKVTVIINLGKKKSEILKGEGRGMKGEEVNKEMGKTRIAARLAGK